MLSYHDSYIYVEILLCNLELILTYSIDNEISIVFNTSKKLNGKE